MIKDLISEICKWHEAGDRIVLMMDSNEHVETGNIVERLQEVGLQKSIIRRHQTVEGLVPTHQKIISY